jgi:hypothetical protein
MGGQRVGRFAQPSTGLGQPFGLMIRHILYCSGIGLQII